MIGTSWINMRSEEIMAKVDKYEQARRDGISYALKIVKESGVEGLEKEVQYRNITKHPIGLEQDYLDEWLHRVKMVLIGAMKCASVMTLHDRFGFGNIRCSRYLDDFSEKVDAVFQNYASLEDFREVIKEEIGLDIFYLNEPTQITIKNHTEAGL